MPEEPEVTPEETIPAETPPPAAGVDINATVEVDGEQVKVADLIASQRQAKHLSEWQGHARTVMQGGGELDDRTEGSLRYVMSAEGWAPDDINQYIDNLKNPGDEAVDETEDPLGGGEEAPSEGDAMREYVARLEARVEAAEGRQGEANVERMQELMSRSVEGVLDNHEGIRILLEKTKELQGEDAVKATRETLGAAVNRQLLDLLKHRKASTGSRFQNEWFGEESENAAKLVVDMYRSVIGDPDKLQRAPETDTGEDSLVVRKDPQAPKYEKGDQAAEVLAKSKNYTEQVLKHLAYQTEHGGKTQA